MAKDSKSVDSKNISVEKGSDADSSLEVTSNDPKSKLDKKINSVNLLNEFEESQLKKELPEIYVGDTVKVGVKITEGNKERVQPVSYTHLTLPTKG